MAAVDEGGRPRTAMLVSLEAEEVLVRLRALGAEEVLVRLRALGAEEVLLRLGALGARQMQMRLGVEEMQMRLGAVAVEGMPAQHAALWAGDVLARLVVGAGEVTRFPASGAGEGPAPLAVEAGLAWR